MGIHVASKQVCLLLCLLWLAPCTLLWALLGLLCEALFDTSLHPCLPFSPGSEAHRCLCNTLPSSALMWLCLLGEVLWKVSPFPALIWLYLLSEVSPKPYPPLPGLTSASLQPTCFFPILVSYPLACQQEYGFFFVVTILVSHSGPLRGGLLALLASGPPSLLNAHNWGLKRGFLVLTQGCLLVMSYPPSKVHCEVFFLQSFS